MIANGERSKARLAMARRTEIFARFAAAAVVLFVCAGAGTCSSKKPVTAAEKAMQNEEDGHVTTLIIDEVGTAVSGQSVDFPLSVTVKVSAGDGN